MRQIDSRTTLDRRDVALLTGAGLLAVSAGVHLRLYVGGYRDIHLQRVLGVDLAGTFAIGVISGCLLATLVVASVIYARGTRITALAGSLYALGALVAYTLTRSTGFLGFEETRWVPEAIVAKPAELAAVGMLLLAARRGRPAISPERAPSTPSRGSPS